MDNEAPSLAAMFAAMMNGRKPDEPFGPQRAIGRRRRSLADLLNEHGMIEGFALDGDRARIGNAYRGPLAPEGIERQPGLSRRWIAGPKRFGL